MMEVIRSDAPGTFALALRKPLGVVAGISPWNGAHVLAWRTLVNPLAFGNTVVLKPSEEAPVSAGLLLPEILAEAGFPAGVVNVVAHAPGEAGPIADEFFDRPEVRCINFTGSSATGRLLAERAGRHLKRCVLELGGYNPLIVLADADLDYAVEATAFDEAVMIANSTRYGLSAGLITGDNQRGFALARRIDAGAVHVNDQTVADEPQLPLGGTRDSGWGRSGPQSIADFTEVQWITTRDGPGHFPI